MRVIGLMSGTSADGIDAVLAEIDERDGRLSMEQMATASLEWPTAEREEIFRLFTASVDARALCRANAQIGRRFVQAALAVIDAAGLTPADVDLIGSHGQTIWHEVVDGRVDSTLQIGEAAVIAEETGITTVANFRSADVAAGGQGAPLVSIFDWLLMRPPASLGGWRALQNIGGIGNVTFLPPLVTTKPPHPTPPHSKEGTGSAPPLEWGRMGGGKQLPPLGTPETEAPPLAFDTGPGNALIDWAAVEMTGGRQHYDAESRLARGGRASQELVARWLDEPYFRRTPPKTTGRELFSPALARRWQEEAQAAALSPADFIASLTELTAASIADAYARFAPGPVAEVVVAGGGARNPLLMERLAWQLAERLGRGVPLLRHTDISGAPGDGDSKEALTFALLAWLAVHGRAGNVPACTGAAGERILGQIAPGRNFARLAGRIWSA